ncbi:sensor histidine kinase [Wenyingzhuangia sp. IMCC45574]
MNPLLKRQLKKYGFENVEKESELGLFLETIGRSYDNYENQFGMLQRSMMISSEELYEANQRLRDDAKQQQEIIEQLKNVVAALNGEQRDELGALQDVSQENLTALMEKQAQEIVRINKERAELLDELASQNEELSEYAHVVSHDLKSPLRSIDALTAWLVEDYSSFLDTEGKETLGLIRTNVEKMDSLITGILEYSTIDKNNYQPYKVDLNVLMHELIRFIEVPNNIEINVIQNLPTILGDKYRLQQLFQNLLVNSIKYNDKEIGSVEIGFVDVGKFYEFYVRDNGKGIEHNYLDKIFKAFFRLEAENSHKSIGIGLSMVKKIVELYHGRIWVNSEVGVGTTFYFTLKK